MTLTFARVVDVVCAVVIGLWLADRVYEWANVVAFRRQMDVML